MNGKTEGFTLIELIVASSILAILATLAYPSYVSHLVKARRADAQGALVGLAAAMERHASANGFKYTGAAGTQANPQDTGAPWIHPATVPVDGGTPTYRLNISAATATRYTLQAIPTGVQAGDPCGTLTLTSAGVRGVNDVQAGLTVRDCWRN